MGVYMKLSRIEYFLAASEKLNFTAAAKSLFISQPALSKQIRLIEDELGVKLFNRSKKKVCLTEAGISFKNDLEAVLGELENAVENAKLIGKKQNNVIRIGCFQGAAIEDLIYMVSERIAQISPETNIIFQRSGFREIREALINNNVDIILTMDFEMAVLYPFNSKIIFTEKSALVYSEKSAVARKDIISVNDFSQIPFLILSPEISYGGYHNSLALIKNLGLNNQKIEIYDSWETLLTYLKMGYGFTILFENVSTKMHGLKQFVIPQAEFSRSVVAVWKNESFLINKIISNL